MKYYVLLFDKNSRDNILKVLSDPVEKEQAERIKEEQNRIADLEKEYADIVPAPGF